MDADERARRHHLWDRYIRMGASWDTVVADVAEEYGVDDATVEDDLETMSQWLPKLDPLRGIGGISALAELRGNRQQLHQLAQQARDQEDLTEERKIREEINDSLNLERRLRESSADVERDDAAIDLNEVIR